MAYGRDRTLITSNGTGSISPGGTVNLPTSSSRCIDISGNYPNANPLEITHRKWGKVGTFSRQSPTATYNFVNYPFTNQGIGGGHGASPLLPNVTATITEAQARTNPSRPEVSIPQALAELREIPAMLHLSGLKHARGRSNSSAVEYNFGWAPIIEDLLKLANFTKQVDERLKELEALHSSRGLRRDWTSHNETYTGSNAATFQTAFSVFIGGNVQWLTRVKRWGSVQWVPDVPFRGTDGDLNALARRIVHGWDLSLGGITATMWNLLPWSWFSDYFFNLGDYLDGQRNGVGAVARLGCVMTHHRTEWKQTVTTSSPANVRPSPGWYTYEQKFRVLASAGLTATVPFLSGRQLVTLSSIAESLGKR
jgi:hypothetical protein